MIGQTVSHYKILDKLGEGGMGVVYKAHDLRLDRPVALKFLSSHLETDGEQKKRFFQEAKAASALDHPNVCTIHEIDQTPAGQTFICMAHYEGETLKNRIRRGPLPLEEAVAVAIQTAQGLSRAHQRGIVHRDIKPANLLITGEEAVKIVDFGLAKLAGQTRLTKTGAIVGTATYLSPEQACGEETDERTDIWSLGVVLYEMLAGQLPFKAEHEQAVVYSVLYENPPPMTDIREGLPKELVRIVGKAMKKDRSERYQRMDEMLADLQAFGRNLPLLSGEKRLYLKSAPKRNKLYAYAGVTVLLAVSIFYYWQTGRKGGGSTGEKESFTKLAILPFDNLRKDPESDFLGFALADQVITKLGYVQSIVCRPSSSVQKYQAAAIDLPKVAHELDVDVVLTANFLKEGNRLRLNAQLVNVAKNEVVWRAPLDLPYSNIFSVQDSISNGIINGLKLHLSTVEEGRLKRDISTNPLAYEYYLRAGASTWISAEDYQVAIQLLEKSVVLDSGFAPAWASLGNAYGLYQIETGADKKYLHLGEDALKQALRINEELPFALYSLAELYAYSGNLEEAAAAVKQALKVSPKAGVVLQSLGFICRYAGLLDLSAQAYVRAKTLDSSDWNLSVSQNQLTKTLIYQGNYQAAIASAGQAIRFIKAKGLATWPQHVFYLGMAHFYAKDRDEAFAIFDSCSALDKSNIWSLFGQTYKAAGQGSQKKLDELLQTLEASNITDPEMSYRFAHFYCFAGQPDKALKALKASVEGGFFSYPYISTDPLLESIRKTKEFQSILVAMKARHLVFKESFGEKFR